jgi:hypothetical protein
MNVWQQAGLLVLGALISGLIGVGVAEFGRWRERQQARRRRQREALVALNDPLQRLLVELSRQLEQGPGAVGQWVNGARDIGVTGTWIFDPTEVANTLDWEPARGLAQKVERTWSDRARLEVFDPVIRAQVEEVRKLARAVGFLSPDIRIVATELSDKLLTLLETISVELEQA